MAKAQVRKDPDGMNEERAERGGVIVGAYMEIPGIDDDPGSVITDMLSDLMHWCAENDLDFANAIRMAHFHYEAETETTADWYIEVEG